MGPYGRQWFSLQDRSPAVMAAGARAARAGLDAFLDAELARRACRAPPWRWPGSARAA